MCNECVFSPDRRYRYTLVHRWDELFDPGRGIAWIGLNPSTADEHRLDPTLRRIRAYSAAWGYAYFVMLNLFAWRATDPARMKAAGDPVGPDNDRWIMRWSSRVDRVMLAWGEHGAHLGRDRAVLDLLGGDNIFCLGRNASGQPKHPLYVAGAATAVPYH